MHDKIVLVAETGSDIPAGLAEKKGIFLVPMHVSIGDETLDDGGFPVGRILEYYNTTGKVPQTSASTPFDFETVFDSIHAKWPDKQILHLAYSAATTCSYQNAFLAAKGRGYVTSLDTKHVSVGQAAVVLAVARFLEENPHCAMDEAVAAAQDIAANTRMCFLPRNLDYLRAGGRVSNAAAMVGNFLGLHPCIEIIDGKLMARKKYRGKLDTIIPKLMREFTEAQQLAGKKLYFIFSIGLEERLRGIAEKAAKEIGFEEFAWMSTGCVITCHCGPGSFGIVGSRA